MRDLQVEERVPVSKKKEEKRGTQQPLTQQFVRPDIPMPDEFGMETVLFKCWRCLRTDARSKEVAEAYARNNKKLFCTACDRPDMFEWDVEVLSDGTKREYLRALTEKEMRDRISPEAHALAAKQALVQNLRYRAVQILKLTTELEVEYHGLMKAIVQAEEDVQAAEILVSAMEKDEIGKKLTNLEKLKENVMRLTSEIEAAKKANVEATHRATGGGD